MPRLYSAGETACNGVHGRNRLASNSLLESLVFARRAALDITNGYEAADNKIAPVINKDEYENYKEKYEALVLSTIEKEKNK